MDLEHYRKRREALLEGKSEEEQKEILEELAEGYEGILKDLKATNRHAASMEWFIIIFFATIFIAIIVAAIKSYQ